MQHEEGITFWNKMAAIYDEHQYKDNYKKLVQRITRDVGTADHVLDVAIAAHERPDLTPGLAGDVAQLPGKILRNQPVTWKAPLVEVTETTELARLETVGLTVQL